MDLQRRRSQTILPSVMVAAFTSGIVLLINVWGQKKSGGTADPNGQIKDVHKCMDVLKNNENRWHSAGRLWDILYELASFGDLPLPQPSPKESNKRERDAESSPAAPSTIASSNEQTPSPNAGVGSSRPIAKPRSVMTKPQPSQQPQQVQQGVQPQSQQHYAHTPYTQPHHLAAPQSHPHSHPFGVGNLPVNTAELGSMHHLPPDFAFEQQNNPLHGIWHEQSHDPLVSVFGQGGPAQGYGAAPATGMGGGGASAGYYPQQSPVQPQQQPAMGYSYAGPEQNVGFTPGMAAQPFLGGGAFEMWQQAPAGFEVDDWGAMLAQDPMMGGMQGNMGAGAQHGMQQQMHPGQPRPGQQ